MSRTKVSQQKVFQAAEKINAKGVAPTCGRIREEIGGGSYSTILPLLQAWREEQAENQTAENPLPEPLMDEVVLFAQQFWRGAYKEAAEQSASRYRQAETQIEQMTEERGELLQDNERLDQELTKERAGAKQLRTQLHDLTNSLHQIEKRVVELTARLEERDRTLAAAQAENDRLEAAREALQARLIALVEAGSGSPPT